METTILSRVVDATTSLDRRMERAARTSNIKRDRGNPILKTNKSHVHLVKSDIVLKTPEETKEPPQYGRDRDASTPTCSGVQKKLLIQNLTPLDGAYQP